MGMKFINKFFSYLIPSALIVLGSISSSYAALLVSDPGAWESTITFDELSLVTNQDITDEWAAFGVTFQDLKWFEAADTDVSWGGISGSHLFESYGDLGTDSFEISIAFEDIVNSAGFNFRTGDGPPSIVPRDATIRFEAFLDGILKDSYEGVFLGTFEPTPEQYFGFTGFAFNQIEVRMLNPDTSAPCCGANIDNLSFNSAVQVPSPGSLPLFVGGMCILLAVGRKNQNSIIRC